MKDGVAKSTGNSRYLRGAGWPATYEEFRQLAAEGKLPFDLADINPEGWAVLGDALNKANLLPDDVCALLGLPSTAVPKDALEFLGSGYGKVVDADTWELYQPFAFRSGMTLFDGIKKTLDNGCYTPDVSVYFKVDNSGNRPVIQMCDATTDAIFASATCQNYFSDITAVGSRYVIVSYLGSSSYSGGYQIFTYDIAEKTITSVLSRTRGKRLWFVGMQGLYKNSIENDKAQLILQIWEAGSSTTRDLRAVYIDKSNNTAPEIAIASNSNSNGYSADAVALNDCFVVIYGAGAGSTYSGIQIKNSAVQSSTTLPKFDRIGGCSAQNEVFYWHDSDGYMNCTRVNGWQHVSKAAMQFVDAMDTPLGVFAVSMTGAARRDLLKIDPLTMKVLERYPCFEMSELGALSAFGYSPMPNLDGSSNTMFKTSIRLDGYSNRARVFETRLTAMLSFLKGVSG